MEKRDLWGEGFWAGVLTLLSGAFVAVLIAAKLRPKPEPALPPETPPQPQPAPEVGRGIGFHQHLPELQPGRDQERDGRQ